MIYLFLAVIAQTTALILGKTAGLNYTGFSRYLSIEYIGSLTALMGQALVWQQALKKYPLSIAYPFMSIVFLIIPAVSYLVFNEQISSGQIAGAILIAAGTIQLTRAAKQTPSDPLEEL